MKLDPVIAEIRQAREAYAEKFSGNVRAMLADIRSRQQQSGRSTIAHPPKRIDIRPQPASADAN